MRQARVRARSVSFILGTSGKPLEGFQHRVTQSNLHLQKITWAVAQRTKWKHGGQLGASASERGWWPGWGGWQRGGEEWACVRSGSELKAAPPESWRKARVIRVGRKRGQDDVAEDGKTEAVWARDGAQRRRTRHAPHSPALLTQAPCFPFSASTFPHIKIPAS